MNIIIGAQKTAKERNINLTNWANKQRDYIKDLSENEKDIISNYTTGEFEEAEYIINNNSAIVESGESSKSANKLLKMIKNAPSLPIKVTLFRGIPNIYPNGNILVCPYLSSTSFNKRVAEEFVTSKSEEDSTCCIYILNIPADSKCLLLGLRNHYEWDNVDPSFKSRINIFFDEQYEVLFPPFVGKVINKIIKNNLTYYYIDDIIFPDVKYHKKLKQFILKY
jgi:hypothetical protein